ncbi:MAG: hypothetical protein COA78_24150 [Blastopirellula sp.]|nr:MAG: hypothetical protein COA78_24150 [Blastopirellula sp.]
MMFPQSYSVVIQKPFLSLLVLVITLSQTGCISNWLSGSDEDLLDNSLADWEQVVTVGDLTIPLGTNQARAVSAAMANSLNNTGGDPEISPAQDIVLTEMKILQVENPNRILQLPTTAVVILEAIIPAGAKKGDRIDIKVTAPKGSNCISLERGYVLPSLMSEKLVLGGRIRSGSTLVHARGPIVVNAVREGIESPKLLIEGVILGGGIVAKDRPLGLRIRDSEVSVQVSSQIGAVINARFFSYDRGIKKGIANPRDDKYVGLKVHPKYRNNIRRFIRVVRFIPLRETTQQRAERIVTIEEELLHPDTTQLAAMKLEALGDISIASLKKGLASSNSKVRFCSAEALTYLDDLEGIPYLVEAVRNESVFRHWALLALNTKNHDLNVVEEFESLLNAKSAEARYGAFDALRKRNTIFTMGKTFDLGEEMDAYQIRSTADPLVHFRLEGRSEMVIFGSKVQVQGPIAMVRPGGMTIRSLDSNRLRISYFSAGQDDRNIVCNRDLSDVCKAIVDLGGSYSDLIRICFELQKSGSLNARVEIDALPSSNRVYYVENEDDSADLTASADDEFNFLEEETEESIEQNSFGFGTLF